MADDNNQKTKIQKPKTKQQTREDKLAQALRDNLRRRKQSAIDGVNDEIKPEK